MVLVAVTELVKVVESGDSKLYCAVTVFTYFKAPPEGAAVTSATKETVASLLAAMVGIEIPAVGSADASGEPLIDTEPVLKDRKSTRLNSSHANISYAVFCLKKKKNQNHYLI